MIDGLSILHYNVGKRKHVQWSIFNDTNLQDFAALAILEPYIYEDPNDGQPRTHQHGRWYAMTPSRHRAGVYTRHVFRAMLYFNVCMHARQIPVDDPDIVAATMRLRGMTVLIAAIYDPRSEPHVGDREAALQEKLGHVRKLVDATRQAIGDALQIILCTDLNRHDVLWGGIAGVAPDRRDEGIQVVNLAQEYGLQSLLTPGTVTWEQPGGVARSSIDVILASEGMVECQTCCRVYGTDHGSDHKPIEMRFHLVADAPRDRRRKLQFQKADWKTIGHAIATRLPLSDIPGRISEDELEKCAVHFTSVVTEEIHSRVPWAKPSPYVKRWWTPELTVLRSNMTAARNAVTTQRRRGEALDEVQEKFSLAKRRFCQEMETQKKRHWHDFLADQNNIWKANSISKLVSRETRIPTLHNESRTAETDEEKADVLMESFFPIPPPPQGPLATRQAEEGQHTRVGPLPAVTDEEIERAITRPNPNKAPGPDEIPFSVWRQLLPHTREWIKWLYQASMSLGHVPRQWREASIVVLRKPGKKDYSNPRAYRPISLLPTISKGLESIVAARLSYMAERYNLLPNNHFGARKHRSSEQALNVLVECIHQAWKTGKVLSLVTFDVQGAFNGVHRSVLCSRLRQAGIPEMMVAWIRSFCEGRAGKVIVGQYESAMRPIAHAGIPQGSPLSPILYIFYNAGLVRGDIDASKGSLGFVDDFTTWVTTPSAMEGTSAIQRDVIPKIEQWAEQSGATFDLEKTAFVHFVRPRSKVNAETSLKFRGVEVVSKPAVKLLGVILDAHLNMSAHLEKVTLAATKKCLAIGRLREMRPRQKRQLFNAMVTPTTDYAASVWFYRGLKGSRRHLRRLERVQRLGAVMIIGAFRTVSFNVLQDEACLEAVEQRLTRKVARHAVDVMTTNQGHPIHKVLSLQEKGRYRSPLAHTILRYGSQAQEDGLVGMNSRLPYTVQPWTTLPPIVVPQSAEEAMKRYKDSLRTRKALMLYPDASVRNKVAGVAVTAVDFGRSGRVPALVYQAIVGWEHTCSVTAAELKGIELAVLYARSMGRRFTVVTDSQESITLINKNDRSAKATEAAGAVLRALGSCLEERLDFEILWVPSHTGVAGNDAADRAAREMTQAPGQPTRVPAFRVSERAKVMGRVREAVGRENMVPPALWGSCTYKLDAALPGKHVLKLYGMLSREEASILAQARTGHARVNAYLARIKAAENSKCDCGVGDETVSHVLLCCERWNHLRGGLKERAGQRWGDISYLLGGRSSRRHPITRRLIDKPEKWRPDCKMVWETVRFLKATGRFQARPPGETHTP